MFAAVAPLYMVMLINVLGPAYVVWDKSATIRFLKPGRSTLAVNRVYLVELRDRDGTVCATVEKTLHIKRKQD